MGLQDFLHMSGYGAYVWSCFGLTFAVLIYNVWAARHEWSEQVLKARQRLESPTGGPSS
jgi:heme exporter protein CcmD